jgi:CheY-like chemotaxis protein
MTQILIVEDDKMLRDAFTILLEVEQYDVTGASNGKEALALCQTNEYDVILLDLMMPIMDGLGFLEKADMGNRAPRTRIVLLSNLSSGETIEKATQLGIHRREIKSNLSPKEILAVVAEELAYTGSPATSAAR